MNESYRFDIAPIKQHVDEPHSIFSGAQSTVNSVRCHNARSKSWRLRDTSIATIKQHFLAMRATSRPIALFLLLSCLLERPNSVPSSMSTVSKTGHVGQAHCHHLHSCPDFYLIDLAKMMCHVPHRLVVFIC
jgi:hypothetical protein